jgi:hypothetical protein
MRGMFVSAHLALSFAIGQRPETAGRDASKIGGGREDLNTGFSGSLACFCQISKQHPQHRFVLLSLMDRFLEDDTVPELDRAVHEIAEATDRYLEVAVCSCGARFSLEAKPRCQKCHAILVDSYFHYVD